MLTLLFCVSGLGEGAVAWHGKFIGFVHPKLGWSTDLFSAVAPSALAYNAEEFDNNAVESLIFSVNDQARPRQDRILVL
jgi:hypothetical protein